MLRRFLLVGLTLALLALPLRAAATDYTDIWYLASESGYGFEMVQAEDIIFITFFIYDINNVPTWYVGTMQRDVNGNFSGNLYSTVGTYFGAPWVTAGYNPTLVGTVSFSPSGPYAGTVTYNVFLVTATKMIQRQTLKTIALGGNYVGGQAGIYAGACAAAGQRYQRNFFPLTVTQRSDGTASFAFTYTNGLRCSISGMLVQQGQLYSIPSANYACSDGTNTPASVGELKATAYGIEGTLAAPFIFYNGCTESATFSGTLFSPGGVADKAVAERTRTGRSPPPPPR